MELLGHQRDGVLRDLMQRARAFVFAAEEDFGIVPVEAQACGTPVIAFGRGGVRETVVSEVTGLFFDEQTPESVCAAVGQFEVWPAAFDRSACRQSAERFSAVRFRAELSRRIASCWEEFQSGLA